MKISSVRGQDDSLLILRGKTMICLKSCVLLAPCNCMCL